jgi:hypothetical protein
MERKAAPAIVVPWEATPRGSAPQVALLWSERFRPRGVCDAVAVLPPPAEPTGPTHVGRLAKRQGIVSLPVGTVKRRNVPCVGRNRFAAVGKPSQAPAQRLATTTRPRPWNATLFVAKTPPATLRQRLRRVETRASTRRVRLGHVLRLTKPFFPVSVTTGERVRCHRQPTAARGSPAADALPLAPGAVLYGRWCHSPKVG